MSGSQRLGLVERQVAAEMGAVGGRAAVLADGLGEMRIQLGRQAGVAGHLTIGDDVVLTAKSATSHDIPAGKVISGIPAFDNKDWLRSTAAFRRLGEIQRTVRNLERKLKSAD